MGAAGRRRRSETPGRPRQLLADGAPERELARHRVRLHLRRVHAWQAAGSERRRSSGGASAWRSTAGEAACLYLLAVGLLRLLNTSGWAGSGRSATNAGATRGQRSRRSVSVLPATAWLMSLALNTRADPPRMAGGAGGTSRTLPPLPLPQFQATTAPSGAPCNGLALAHYEGSQSTEASLHPLNSCRPTACRWQKSGEPVNTGINRPTQQGRRQCNKARINPGMFII